LGHNKTIISDFTDPDNIEYYFNCERCGATRLQPSNWFEDASLHILRLRDSRKKKK
jgi:hypothetical protein